jgi:hypothetical protein
MPPVDLSAPSFLPETARPNTGPKPACTSFSRNRLLHMYSQSPSVQEPGLSAKMFWRIGTPETSDLPNHLTVRLRTLLLSISTEYAISPKALEKSLSNLIVLEGDHHASIFRYRDPWNAPNPSGGGKFTSFEFPLFQPSLAHELPSPWIDPLPPDSSVLAEESAKWNAVHGRPPVHSKRESHYDGSTFIPEAEEEDDFHRAGDIVFVAFYPIGEVHPKPTTRGGTTYNPKWTVHYVPQYVARLARVPRKRKAEEMEREVAGVTAETLKKWEDTHTPQAGPSSPKKVKRIEMKFP